MRLDISSQISLTRVSKKYYQPDDVFELSRVTRHEKVRTEIFEHETLGSTSIAAEIAALIRLKQERGESCTLGLTNGKSPVGIYRELVRLHRDEGLSFSNVIVFILF